jgi:hypothetical protein
MPATPELLAAVENQALRCGNERLALRALYLRTGNDDFIGDAELLVDIIEVEADYSARALKEAPEVIERGSAAMAALCAQDIVQSLELQLLAARRLVEFLEAGSKVGGAR